MTKDELENIVFNSLVDTCIELELSKSYDLEPVYDKVRNYFNNLTKDRIYVTIMKDYATGYVDIHCNDFGVNDLHINMYIDEADIKNSATEKVRISKLNKIFND